MQKIKAEAIRITIEAAANADTLYKTITTVNRTLDAIL